MHGSDAVAAPAKGGKGKAAAAAKAGEDVAVLKTTLGTIVFKFFDKDAPNHVANFKELANTHFYDGTTFHRVIPGFMIQGGDPNSKDADRSNDGMGNGPRTLKAEFNQPHGVIVHPKTGDVYVSDASNGRVLKIARE